MSPDRDALTMSSPLAPVDRHLKMLVFLFVGFGLVMVYSASSVLSIVRHGNSTVYFVNQLTKAAIGVAAMIVLARIDYRIWERVSKPMMWTGVLMLVLLVVPVATALTPEINGARRWISLPGFQFQPLEVARLALIVWMAATIARKGRRMDRFSDGVAPILIVPLIMSALLILQPDFKGASLVMALALAMLYLGGTRLRFMLGITALAVPLVGVVMVAEPYRMRRLVSFLHPGQDVQGISYQINQSLISLGSGGWFGVGLGSSKQKFAFLPAAHNDFIFSIVGEELGVLGTLLVLTAFLYFGYVGFRIARRTEDPFGFLLASGLTTLIVTMALVNIGVATAALPTTGLTLPFISYGGTALIVQLVAVGILMSISRHAAPTPLGRKRPRAGQAHRSGGRARGSRRGS